MIDDDDVETAQAAMRESDALIEQIRPILSGKSPEVIGTTVAHLLAIFIAGHAPPLRETARRLLIDCAEGLVPVIVAEMIEAGRAPPDWQGDDAMPETTEEWFKRATLRSPQDKPQ